MAVKNFWQKMLVITFILGMTVVGSVEGSAARDYIKITSITPNKNLIDGVVQEFVVTVEYILSTKERGIIYIGFNYNTPARYTLVQATSTLKGLVVSRGRGTHTFTVKATTKNWYSNGKFGVYANISPYPHESSWYPLDYNIVPLSF